MIIPQKLRELGFDVQSISELYVGEDDPKILQLATQQNRILITLDKDFGELIFKDKLIHAGVIFIRLKDDSTPNKLKILIKILTSGKNYSRKFTVIREKAKS